jgi:hypothetical protein
MNKPDQVNHRTPPQDMPRKFYASFLLRAVRAATHGNQPKVGSFVAAAAFRDSGDSSTVCHLLLHISDHRLRQDLAGQTEAQVGNGQDPTGRLGNDDKSK